MRLRKAPKLVEIREDFALPGLHEIQEGTSSAKVLVGEEIDALGIDGVTSKLYHVVIENVPCGHAGLVNENVRVYFPQEMSREFLRLATEAPTRFIDGEEGHAQGAETFKIPVRFLGGEIKEGANDTLTTMGRFGILKTPEGDRIHTLWEAKFPLGTSLVGLCYMTEAVLEEDGAFAKANPDHVGETITFCTGLILKKHDIVRRASAGTYFPMSEEAREALRAIDEAGDLPASPEPVTPPTPDKPGDVAEEEDMTREELLKLLADHPEVAASYRASVAEDVLKEHAKTDPLAGATNEDKLAVASLLTKLHEKSDADPTKTLVEQANADREQVQALKSENATLRAAQETSAKAVADIQKDLAAAKLRAEVLEAVDAKAAGTYGSKVKAHVLTRFDEGKVTSAEEAEKLFDEVEALMKGVAVVESTQTDTPSTGDPKDVTKPDADPQPTTEGAKPAADAATVTAPGLLNGDSAIIKAMQNRGPRRERR